MSSFDFQITGFRQLEARLNQLSREEATKAGQSANRAGAALLKKAVEQEAPDSPRTTEGEKRTRRNKSGTTRDETHHKISQNVKVRKVRAPEGRVENLVHIAKGYHAHMVEFGSIHNAPNPFMLRALENSKDDIIAEIAKALNRGLIRRGV